jgi:hypothetical protein
MRDEEFERDDRKAAINLARHRVSFVKSAMPRRWPIPMPGR